jgi:hypothetical protein
VHSEGSAADALHAVKWRFAISIVFEHRKYAPRIFINCGFFGSICIARRVYSVKLSSFFSSSDMFAAMSKNSTEAGEYLSNLLTSFCAPEDRDLRRDPDLSADSSEPRPGLPRHPTIPFWLTRFMTPDATSGWEGRSLATPHRN